MKKIGGLEANANLILILILYYLSNRKSRLVAIDWLLIVALLFTSVSGIFLLIFEGEELRMFINTVGFYLTHLMYINIFRKEGTNLPPFFSNLKDWKILLLTIIFLVGFLYIIIPNVPTNLLVLSFIYSTQMAILGWMAYFRTINKKAYIEGIIGIILLVLSNLWLSINLLKHHYPYTVFIYFIMYATSQLLIARSIF